MAFDAQNIVLLDETASSAALLLALGPGALTAFIAAAIAIAIDQTSTVDSVDS